MGFFNKKDTPDFNEIENLLREKIFLSTSSNVPTKNIISYKGVVFAENEFFPKLRNTVDAFTEVRLMTLLNLSEKALATGANAIVDLSVQFAPYNAQGSAWGICMLVASGTAVVVE